MGIKIVKMRGMLFKKEQSDCKIGRRGDLQWKKIERREEGRKEFQGSRA